MAQIQCIDIYIYINNIPETNIFLGLGRNFSKGIYFN